MVPTWHRELSRTCENIPIVLCGNKADVKDRQITPKQVTFHRKKSLQYYEISCKSTYNYEKPFLYLARKLVDEKLCFDAEQAALPPDDEYDLDAMSKNEEELKAAAEQPLPDDEDDGLLE